MILEGKLREKAETALALSTLAYLPELARGGYHFVGEFLDSYLSAPKAERPTTMFDGLCSDERSGTVRAIRRMRRDPRICGLCIVYDSHSGDRFNSFCCVDGSREVFVIFGGNYRIGDYTSAYGAVSSWRDNFFGAADVRTAEQREALDFYDRALAAARASLPRGTALSVTVAGHSKGGNLAQYVTLFRSSVDRCFSFDGQGFSEGFVSRYAEVIGRRSSRIISILPGRSIVGASLTPLYGAERLYVRAELPGVRMTAIHCHIPTSLADEKGHLRQFEKGPSLMSRTVSLLSAGTVRTARKLPFINVRRGLGRIGAAIQYTFKEEPRRGLRELRSPDALGLLAAALLRLPFDFLRAIFRREEP